METGVEPARGAMTGGRFVLAWRLGRDTSLATVAERIEWATFVLPPMVRAGFSKNNDKEIEARTNAAVVELSLKNSTSTYSFLNCEYRNYATEVFFIIFLDCLIG